jgi:hypothetical protein
MKDPAPLARRFPRLAASDSESRPSAGWTRREFMGTLAGTALAGALGPLPSRSEIAASATPASIKVSLIATEVRKYSHAQHFLDRLLEGYGWEGRYHHPPFQLASLYVDQFPPGDLSRERAQRHGIKMYSSIPEALTLGGSNLAVDGVLIVGEHGNYPRNAKGQTLYPRYRFFQEVVRVFGQSGRAVPVFNDKHLSTEWAQCVEMVETSQRLGFPFIAGSSLPVTWRIPSIEMPLGTALQESVCVCYGGVDSYDFHGLETAQCMSERRAGGESGVRAIQAVKGEAVWPLLESRAQTRRLLFAALARSHTCSPIPEYPSAPPTLEAIRRASPDAVAYFIEHRDGFQTSVFLLNGLVQDFTYAGLVRGTQRVISCQMYLPMPPAHATLADFFNPLFHSIEETFLSGVPTAPIERTLLTSGLTLFAVESLYRGQVRLLTPELKVAYQARPESHFWRA